jgi:hypothetical protein
MSRLAIFLSTMLYVSNCLAQEPALDQEQLSPITATGNAQTQATGGRAFASDVSEGIRNRWGVILSAYQGYTTDAATVSGESGTNISAVVPRVFLNLGRRRSRMHVDLSAGYRFYNGQRNLDSWDYYGNASYSYQFSRKTTFQIYDQLTSSFNDSWSFVSLNAPISYQPNYSNEVMFNLQRITRNALSAEISTQIGRKANLGLFGTYKTYQYNQDSLENANTFQVGAHFDFKLTRWLYLTNSYSAYLNHVSERVKDDQIHRVQIAGLDFHLARSWRVWAGGGVEFSTEQGYNEARESAMAGIEYGAEKSNLGFTYQHGFTSGIGISQLLMSDVYSADFGYRLTSWLNANLESYYYRSRGLDSDGILETLSSGAGLQFAIRRSLVFSVNGNYQMQRTHDFAIEGLGLHRFNVYAGLQFVWPAPRISRTRVQP